MGINVAIPDYYVVATPTDAAVRQAATDAIAAGGGLIQLPDAAITLTSPLPVASGLFYQGVPPRLAYSTDVPDTAWTLIGGTRFIGNGTFAAFEGNANDLASPQTPFTIDAITNFHAHQIGFDGFTRAFKIGAVNHLGVQYSSLTDLFIRNCSEWGMWLANFMHTDVSRVWTHLCQNGQYYAALCPALTLQPGNSKFHTLFNIIPADGRDSRLCRGIVFEAGGVNARLNEMDVTRLQNNAFSRTQLSVSAAFASGSASISVPDGTKFVVGLPVSFTATNYGVTVDLTYLVLSVVGNAITIGATKTGAANSATGTGSLTLESWGMPCLELGSLNSNAAISNSRFTDVDVEGRAAVGVYVENCNSIGVDLTSLPANRKSDIVMRNAQYCRIQSTPPAITDFDANSGTSQFYGARSTQYQRSCQGLWRDTALSTSALAINGGVTTPGGDIHVRLNGLLYPSSPFGRKQYQRDATIGLTAAQAGDVIFAGATGQTFTLPTIVTDTAPGVSNIGAWFEIWNVSANSVTVATDGTQLFNKVAAKTSVTLAAGNSILAVATKDNSGNLFWAARQSTLVA